MKCLHCGEFVPDNHKICKSCLTHIGETEPRKSAPKQIKPPAPVRDDIALHLCCDACKSENVQVQVVAENKECGCGAVILYTILLCIPVVGWCALIWLLFGQPSVIVTYAVCQNCGFKWVI